MELKNDTNNGGVVYEAQDGGGPGGPTALDVFLYAAGHVGDPMIDIESVRNGLGAAGPLPNKGEPRTVCGMSDHEPINLVFLEINDPGQMLAKFPNATDAGRYRLYEPTLGTYAVEKY